MDSTLGDESNETEESKATTPYCQLAATDSPPVSDVNSRILLTHNHQDASDLNFRFGFDMNSRWGDDRWKWQKRGTWGCNTVLSTEWNRFSPSFWDEFLDITSQRSLTHITFIQVPISSASFPTCLRRRSYSPKKLLKVVMILIGNKAWYAKEPGTTAPCYSLTATNSNLYYLLHFQHPSYQILNMIHTP